MRHRWLIVACALVLAGCGGATKPHQAAKPSQADRMRGVVLTWSKYLNTNQYLKEARLFKLPATMIQGGYVFRLKTAAQIAEWHRILPCAGHVVSIKVAGRFATAVFRLANRKGSKCDAPGALAAARFLIVNGKIVAWQQVAPPAAGLVA